MREAQFNVRQIPGRAKPWLVEVAASYSVTGKRQRFFFKTRDEARAKQAELRTSSRQHGHTFQALPPEVVADATRALQLLEPFPGTTLLHVAQEFIDARAEETKNDTVGEILDYFLEKKEDIRSPRYVDQIRHVRARLVAKGGAMIVSAMDAKGLEKLIAADNPWTQNQNARIFKAALRLAFKRDRITTDLSAKIQLEEVKKADTEIFTPRQAVALMKACDPEVAPAFAIRLFAGVRAEEMTRLPVEDVDVAGAEIYIRDKVSKMKGHDRIIPMEPNLVAWLEAYPPGDQLVPAGWEKKWTETRLAAGLKDNWPQNGLRHSFAAYWLAQHKSLDGLASRLGHFGGLQTLRRHYYRAVGKSDAAKFWNILP